MLFSNLYDWAGLPRTIDIFKGESLLGGRSIDYVYAFYIDKALNDLNKEFQEVDWDVLNSKEKIEKICYFVTEFWHIHPFREGNTRTSAMLLYFLINLATFLLDLTLLNSPNFNVSELFLKDIIFL